METDGRPGRRKERNMMTHFSHTVHTPRTGGADPEGATRPGPARLLRLIGVRAGILCLLTLLGLTALSAGAARAETAEWTVMLYMCGTDLESKYALGTYNLNDIASMWFPKAVTARTESGLAMTDWSIDGVNLVVQTGGARKWHGLEPDEDGRTLGLDIPTDRLSRYAVDFVDTPEGYGFVPEFTLADEQPLASMGAPDTLSSFIQWAAHAYPAEKYALVLWDHGGGSRTGLFVDELFDNDILYLYELGQALADGGARLELVAIDACLMCSVETARTLAPYANYMVASEEVAAGYGSAIPQWLREIYRNPGCDGAELGCEFCDATQHKYVENGTALEEMQLTFSVIDLSYMGAVAEAFDRLFEYAGELYEQIPSQFNTFCYYLADSEKYGAGGADMIDLGSFLYEEATLTMVDMDCRNALASALEDAVYYTVKGGARSSSKGLSFCLAQDMSPEEMDVFALNCKSAPYLALLDAVDENWTAPDWVYEKARRLTPIDELDAYRMEWEMTEIDGLPALRFLVKGSRFLDCMFNLYRLDEDSDTICLLGTSDTLIDWDEEGNPCYMINAPTAWPSIEGEPCCIELVEVSGGTFLYNAPIRMDQARTNLRVRGVRTFDEASGRWVDEYEALGLWEGYDEDTRMPARSVTSLYRVSGQSYKLLYPCCTLDGELEGHYTPSAPLKMYRALEIDNTPLPAGTYYCGFTIRDIFGRKYNTALTGLTWDGNAFSPCTTDRAVK